MRWIVLRSEILRRGFVRIRLALVVEHFRGIALGFFRFIRRRMNFFDVGANLVIFGVSVFVLARTYERSRFLRATERFAR